MLSISPEKMATCLAAQPNLEALSIHAFESESREGARQARSLRGLDTDPFGILGSSVADETDGSKCKRRRRKGELVQRII